MSIQFGHVIIHGITPKKINAKACDANNIQNHPSPRKTGEFGTGLRVEAKHGYRFNDVSNEPGSTFIPTFGEEEDHAVVAWLQNFFPDMVYTSFYPNRKWE